MTSSLWACSFTGFNGIPRKFVEHVEFLELKFEILKINVDTEGYEKILDCVEFAHQTQANLVKGFRDPSLQRAFGYFGICMYKIL